MINLALQIMLMALMSFFITYIVCDLLIRKGGVLVAHIKPELMDEQEEKQGTPNIGGVAMLAGILAPVFLFIGLTPEIQFALLALVLFSLLGFLDDVLKTKTVNGDGISPKKKLLLQFACAFVLVAFGGTKGLLHTGFAWLDAIPWLQTAVLVFLLVYFVNAFNISDGLDGLAVNLMFPILAFFFLAMLMVPQMKQLLLLLLAVFVACLAFLVFNHYPARCFMGDCGSMGLGAMLFVLSVIFNVVPFFLVATLMFSIELFSSLVQIIAIRLFHRKVFSIAPVHHMYQKMGQDEDTIVRRFTMYSTLFSIVALLVYLCLI
ncbi:MAG: hypothetical protein LKE40_02895 [Spirochaetia bacterium]|jgi:phospho-N-acetylmuramoyl-pentapeptide-transferase|nr:hypothetical protein [Spirochaetia bacterium]